MKCIIIILTLGLAPYLHAHGSLELIVVTTEERLNWDNPTKLQFGFYKALMQTIKAEKIYKKERTSLGHGFVRYQCFTGKEYVDFWSGINGHKNLPALRLTLGRAGLSVLTYRYKGYLQSREFIHTYLNDILDQPDLKASFVRIKINRKQCRRIKRHYEEFTNNSNLQYGFIVDPSKAEGGGCTAYIVSFAQKAKVFDEYLKKQWFRTVNIAVQHLGPTDQTNEINGIPLQPISMLRFLIPFISVKWHHPDEPVVTITYPDPQFMDDFIRSSMNYLTNKSATHHHPGLVQLLTDRKAKIASNEYMNGIEITLD